MDYQFFLTSILIFGAYIISLVFVKINKLTLLKQRQFWNVILLITFLISGILGLILAWSIDQKVSIAWYMPALKLHVKMGIVMAWVAIFHIIWHLWYFKGLFEKK